jgi:hypothetical protein
LQVRPRLPRRSARKTLCAVRQGPKWCGRA